MEHMTTPAIAEAVTAAQVAAMPMGVVREVLWHFGDLVLGTQPGGFVSALLVAMNRADAENFAKLALVYEHHAAGINAVSRVPGGLEMLRKRAKDEDEALAVTR